MCPCKTDIESGSVGAIADCSRKVFLGFCIVFLLKFFCAKSVVNYRESVVKTRVLFLTTHVMGLLIVFQGKMEFIQFEKAIYRLQRYDVYTVNSLFHII